MKPKPIIIIVCCVLIAAFALGITGAIRFAQESEQESNDGDISFRSLDPDDPLNVVHCDVQLKNCSYTDTEFKASISGTLFVKTSSGYREIALLEETVTFTQRYGAVWKAEVHSADGKVTAPLYMVRHGVGPINGTEMELSFDDHRITVGESERYTRALYLFHGKYEYLIFNK